jgi:hypothetical protein
MSGSLGLVSEGIGRGDRPATLRERVKTATGDEKQAISKALSLSSIASSSWNFTLAGSVEES